MVAHQAMSDTTILDLPEHVLSCIVCLLQQDILLSMSDASGVAALRCVCQSLRHAVDATMTQAVFHTSLGADELDGVLRRRTGSSVSLGFSLQIAHSSFVTALVHLSNKTNGCSL